MNDLPYNGNYPPGMKESDIPGIDNEDDEFDEDEYGLYDDEPEYYREDYEEDER